MTEMDRAADMSVALAFVINRIEEESMRSGLPLDKDQRFLLNNLPRHSDAPEFCIGDAEYSVHFCLRDRTYESLCTLAKTAYGRDRELNPGSHDWEFALNVSKLNRHPLCWLLQWGGVKQRRPWWDRWLLILAALLLIFSGMSLMLLVIDKPWSLWRWTVVVIGYGSILLLTYIASRRIEQRQLERNIESYRSTSRFGGAYHAQA